MKLTAFVSAVLLCAAYAPKAHAQIAVYDSYTSSIVSAQYTPTDGNDVVLDKDQFITPLSHIFGSPQTDYDNGVYFDLPIGFNFTYNGTTYNTMSICVNGWVNFGAVPIASTNDPYTLFEVDPPNAAIAPYFGDHYLRPDTTQGFDSSRISYYLDNSTPGAAILTIQWEDLNVNYQTAPFPKQSVASFQLVLYQADNSFAFEYGALSTGNVQTGGCSVGINDQNGTSFMNGLFTTVSDNFDSVRFSRRLTTTWPPSNQPGRAIKFTPFGTNTIGWGDGNADMTGPPQQNLFVTSGDVLTILRAAVTNTPLDSVFGRNAYHGDVNHNGRFTIDSATGYRVYDTTRTTDPFVGHPNQIVYFQATPFDAALIQLYLAGKLPDLPWIYDTVPPFGKLPANIPAALTFGQTLTEQTPRFVTVPIMAQGAGAMSAAFALNYDPNNVRLVSVAPVPGTKHWTMCVNNNNIVMAGVANYSVPTTVANAEFEIIGSVAGESVSTNGMKINDNVSKDISAPLSQPVSDNVLSAYPNPFNAEEGASQITYRTANDGYVTLKIYDVLGNAVRTLVSSDQAHGTYTVSFNGFNDANIALPAGVYFYRLTADGATQTKQLTVYRNGR